MLRSFAGYRAPFIGPDLLAGVTLAAIAIPEQMATAKLGSLPPQFGFFAFIAGTLAFVMFGSNRRMSVGADSTITPIFAGALALMAAAGSPQYIALAAALGLMVGVIVMAAGALRMGWIADLLSVPVTTGFLAGIAIHIIVSQTPGALGVAPVAGGLPHRILLLWGEAPSINLYALAIAAGVLALSVGAHAVSARLPGPLIGMGLATWAVIALGLEGRGVAVLGGVQDGLPRLVMPTVSLDRYPPLLPLALLIALVAMVQTAATARAFPPTSGADPDVDRDYIGLGAGSVLSGLFGSFPVNASPPRTAIVVGSGGRSQLSGLAAIAIVALLLAFGAGLLTHVPKAALSGVLFFVALRLLRIGQMRDVLKASGAEFALIVLTAAAIILLPIESGVAVGIGLSLLHGVWSSARAQIRPMHNVPGTTIWWPITGAAQADSAPGVVVVVGFQAPLSFLNADNFRRQVTASAHVGQGNVKLLILEAAGIIDIDFTAAQVFRTLVADLRRAGVTFALARLEAVEAQRAFIRFGLRALIGEDHIFDSVAGAVAGLAANRSISRDGGFESAR
ncbi:MAG: SulP family inorganic anion transporter [Pseudomonadota bacterium]|nr:SulP family inorganic anion transporter [Pseudomonadota bacterium]